MVKWLWLGLASATLVPLLFIALVGVPGRIPRIINPSEFKSEESIGYQVYRRLFQEFDDNNVVLLGSSPFLDNYQKLWSGLVGATNSYDKKFDLLIEHSGLSPIKGFQGTILRGPWGSKEIVEMVATANKEGKKILVHTTSNESTNLDLTNLRMMIEKRNGSRPWAVSQTMFATQEEELEDLQPPCGAEGSLSKLTCKSELTSKKYFRKHYSTNKLMALVEKYGEKDYLLFVHLPQ